MSLNPPPSNITNKNDPPPLNSRVFIGNLPPPVVKKSDVETPPPKYGRVVGCSPPQGYAFVQYSNPPHARAAVLGENPPLLAGQSLDPPLAGEPKPNRPPPLKRTASAFNPWCPDSLCSGYDFDPPHYRDDFYDRIFEYRGPPPPVPRVVPVKPPPVTIPLVRRVTPPLPVKLFARSAPPANSSAKLKLKSSAPPTIKTELTQITPPIDALLGRLEPPPEEQKLSAGQSPPGVPRGWPWASQLPPGSGREVSTPRFQEARKKESSRSEVSQEDTASEAEAAAEEPLNGDEGEEEGLAREECEDELENSHYTDVEDARLQ
ncbi:RALY protein, partial [Panurus biarmicus]|nr:RALY protein [Panurus biarmicus]